MAARPGEEIRRRPGAGEGAFGSLLNILPQGIVNRMRRGETAIADQVAEATILFCDVVGFTTLSEALTPDRTIDFLSRIFSAFDRLAAEFKVEKMKTIGDAYMAGNRIPEAQPDHADRIAALAPRMLEAVAAVAAATGLKLQARIGVHTGPVVAGVIGTHKFVYDVWGDTVNTASRMEFHSLPGRIQVSAATRKALGDRFNWSGAASSRSRVRRRWRPISSTNADLGARGSIHRTTGGPPTKRRVPCSAASPIGVSLPPTNRMRPGSLGSCRWPESSFFPVRRT